MNKLVSVIITTRNEEKVLGKLLLSIRKQTYKKKEVILIDNNSTDGTITIAKKMGIKIFNFGPERSAQRNFGVRKAQGEYILFLDADMELTKNVIKECIKLIRIDKEISGINIPEIAVGVRFWEKVKAFERSFYNKEGDSITDAVRFFQRKVLKRIGGYDEAMTGPEDWDITDRLRKNGFRIGRIKAKIYHYERIPSILTLMKKKFYYALDVHKYIEKQKISIFSPKTIYFLRPVFYRNSDKIIAHPLLFLGMIFMLSIEITAGALGYFIGRIRSK